MSEIRENILTGYKTKILVHKIKQIEILLLWFSSLWQMTQKTETKESISISGRLRINNLWVPKTKFTRVTTHNLLLQMFFFCNYEFGKEIQGEIFIFLSWFSTIVRSGRPTWLEFLHSAICCQLSHMSIAVFRESEAFQPFTVLSSLPELYKRENIFVLVLF